MEFGWGVEDPQNWKCKSTSYGQPSNFHSLENLIELPCFISKILWIEGMIWVQWKKNYSIET